MSLTAREGRATPGSRRRRLQQGGSGALAAFKPTPSTPVIPTLQARRHAAKAGGADGEAGEPAGPLLRITRAPSRRARRPLTPWFFSPHSGAACAPATWAREILRAAFGVSTGRTRRSEE